MTVLAKEMMSVIVTIEKSEETATSLEASLSSLLNLIENIVVIAATGAEAETITDTRRFPL